MRAFQKQFISVALSVGALASMQTVHAQNKTVK
jgi:hypothetical protein